MVIFAFAQKEFAYYDYRVSEIITGFGRPIHKKMEQMGSEKYGFQTVFDFTDSIFVQTRKAPAKDFLLLSHFH
jgi:hypothetical protein